MHDYAHDIRQAWLTGSTAEPCVRTERQPVAATYGARSLLWPAWYQPERE